MSGDLIDAFRAEAPADKQALITALFDKITLWDLGVTDVQVQADRRRPLPASR